MKTPHAMTLGEAAKATGKSKTTISKYLHNGKLSYLGKDDSGYKIDPAELFRVFPPIDSNRERSLTRNITGVTPENNTDYKAQIEILKVKLESEKNRADNLQIERDDWKEQAQKLLLQAPQKPVERPKGFWARLLSK